MRKALDPPSHDGSRPSGDLAEYVRDSECGGWEDDVEKRAAAGRVGGRKKVRSTPFREKNGTVPFNALGVVQVVPRSVRLH